MNASRGILNVFLVVFLVLGQVTSLAVTPQPVQAAATSNATALVLMNSASGSYGDFQHYIQPYLDHFGVPYTKLDLNTADVPANVGDYALIVIGHRQLDTAGAKLSSAEQTLIANAVSAGSGLVNFDNDLTASGTIGRYAYITSVFGFTYKATASQSNVVIADGVSHYITQKHAEGETIDTGSMTLAGITAPASATTLASAGTSPFLVVKNVTSGRAVQWGTYDWMKYSVFGPLKGLDDLVWRSLVWAARKPFTMQGMPPFVTMRMDDVVEPQSWIHQSIAAGFKPWAGIFTNKIDSTEAADLKSMVDSGNATIAIHAFDEDTADFDNFLYFDHAHAQNFPADQLASNFAAADKWLADNNLSNKTSKYLVPHYYEVGSNALDSLNARGVQFLGTVMDPGQMESSAPWMVAGPFRKYDTGTAYDRNDNIYYAAPLPTDNRFFNCITEFRDADPTTNYEWNPSGGDISGSIQHGTKWLTDALDGMDLATLFSHEYMVTDDVTPSQMGTIMSGIAQNISSYSPMYVTMDYGCQYARAIYNSNISSATYDSGLNRLAVTLTGTTDMPTKFYVFSDQSGTIEQTLVDVTTPFSGTKLVNYDLPAGVSSITVIPSLANVEQGKTEQFTAEGYDSNGQLLTGLSFTWGVAGSAGTINNSGLYTAATTPGTYSNAVHASVGSVTGSATVEVTPTSAPPSLDGPGGPILVIGSSANAFGKYLGEILFAEGLNEFSYADIGSVTATTLSGYDVAILGDTTLSAAQVTMFTTWVNGGGHLIAMHPDKQLASLLGLTDASATLGNAYMKVDTAQAPGKGITDQVIQFHGDADLYTTSSATAIAMLYSSATTATSNPAVTLRNVGSSGGKAAAFTYDLARSVVYTRQGNPAWAGQERDGIAPVRSDDMFFGHMIGDDQPDWIDFNKIQIPQADEQQRLLANLIYNMNADKKPLPRFWYFPKGYKAVIVMAGDDHTMTSAPETNLTIANFDAYDALSPSPCSVADWTCVRSTSYMYPTNPLSDAEAKQYSDLGFEIALHVDSGSGCVNYTKAQLEALIPSMLSDFTAKFPSLPPVETQRTHCITFSDWDSQPIVSTANGIRLDTNYYYWPPTWAQGRSGLFTGSGMIMRFAQQNGTIIDSYQAVTQLTDETELTYPDAAVVLIDNALDATKGYYGAFTTNMHMDDGVNQNALSIITYARSKNVPVVSAKQMLTWVEGRGNSKFSAMTWNGSALNFTVTAGTGTTGLQGMLPKAFGGNQLTALTRGGSPVTFTTQTIKGVDYAVFTSTAGSYVATYAPDTTAPTISAVAAAPAGNGVETITWTTNEAATSRVDYGTSSTSLTSNVSDATLVTSHSLNLTGLAYNTTYYYRVTSADGTGNSATSPVAPNTLSFTTPAQILTLVDTTTANFTQTGTCKVDPDVNDGALRLGAPYDETFTGPAIPADWNQTLWNPTGTVTVDGAMNVDAARETFGAAGTHDYNPGTVLEFYAQFGNDLYQLMGMGAGADPYNDAGTETFAGFGIYNDGTNTGLFARTALNGTATNTYIPGMVGSRHLYRVEWTNTGVNYYIDNNPLAVAAHPVIIASVMHIAESDYTVGTPLSVYSVRVAPYTSPCTFTSRVLDATSIANWLTLAMTGTKPTGTNVTFRVRTGATPDLTSASWTNVAADGTISNADSRYIQYEATLTGGSYTPIVEQVTVSYNLSSNHAPVITEGASTNVTMSEDGTPTPFSLTLHATDSDAGDTLTWSISTAALHGTATASGTGTSKAIGYTPTTNYNGTDSFVVQVSDGKGGTAAITVNVTISAVNDAPSFTKGANQTVLEDAAAQTVTGWATALSAGPTTDESTQALDFIVSNNNNSLFSVQPAISAVGDLSYTPAANASGTATVTVQIHDNGGILNSGVDTSAAQTFTITITGINDVPSFTKGADQTVLEDAGAQTVNGWATAISAGPNEATQTVNFIVSNNNNPLFSVQPAIDLTGKLTYTPAVNANGTATVTVQIHDNGGTTNNGVDTSAAQTFVINVTAVNDAPTFTKGANPTVLEDAGAQTISGWATAMSTGPSDESAQTVSFIVSNISNPTLFSAAPVVSPAGVLTFTPAVNANGTSTVNVQIKDNGGTANGGVDTSAAQTLTITVTAVNDAPSFTKGADQNVAEDASAQTVTSWATNILAGPANENAQIVDFVVTNNNNALFSAQPAITAAGTLTYTPAANANGAAVVTVKIHDNGGTANNGVDTSASQTFNISVSAANDRPVANPQTVSTNEDIALNITLTGSDVDNTTLTFTVATNPAHGTLSGTAPNLTYTPAPNYNGSDSFTFTASDGSLTSTAATITINVAAVNDVPSFTKGVDQTVLEDAGAQTVTGWASAISAGPANENTQAVNFIVTNSNNALFSTQPAIDTTGKLTYTLAANANGTAVVTVKLHDNGGTANGGVDTSAAQTFNITVTAVNDIPSFTKGSNQTVVEDAGAQSVSGWATSISAGPANESTQVLDFIITSDNNALFSAQPAVDAAGKLTYTPAANANGVANVTIKIHDNGGITNGGVDTSAAQTFTITVTAVNDRPVANAQTLGTIEDTALNIILTGSDVENSPLTFTVATNPTHGTLTGTVPNLTYTPAANYSGADSFTFTVSDGALTSTAATITINVVPVGDPPVANAQTITASEDTASNITLTGSDPEGATVSFAIATNPAHGTLSGAAPNVTYTPAKDYSGDDSFTFKVNDGALDSPAATVSITVNPVNDKPVANNGEATVGVGKFVVIDLSLLASDLETAAKNMTFVIDAQPTHGTLTQDGYLVTYQTEEGFTGEVTFSYHLVDRGDPDNCSPVGSGCSAPLSSSQAVVTITVTPTYTIFMPNIGR